MFDSRTDHPHKGVHWYRSYAKDEADKRGGWRLPPRKEQPKARAIAEGLREHQDLLDEQAVALDGFDRFDRVWRTIEDAWGEQAPYRTESDGYPVRRVSVVARVDLRDAARGSWSPQPVQYGSLIQVSTRQRTRR